MKLFVGILLVLGVIVLLDRALLAAERRGWIYYRNHRPVRGVSMYHINELSEMLGGHGVPEVQEEVEIEQPGEPPLGAAGGGE